MASDLCGKWKICASEYFDEYMKAVGVSDENRAIANKHFSSDSDLQQEISQDGGNWSIKTITSLGEREVTFKIGEEYNSATLDGRVVKVTTLIDGNSLVETQKGDGFESKISRKKEGDLMIMTMTGGGVVCTRKYKSA